MYKLISMFIEKDHINDNSEETKSEEINYNII